MTPAEIITLARSLFGEETPNTVSEDTARSYLNSALTEIWTDLPSDNLKPLLEIESVTTTDGAGDIDSEWNRIIEVYVDSFPATAVPRDVITGADFGDLFTPAVPIYNIDEKKIFVRPKDAGDVEIVQVKAPTRITSSTEESDLTEIPEVYHEALASLVASYMYLQEEDAAQAQAFRAEYSNMITSMSQQMAAEE